MKMTIIMRTFLVKHYLQNKLHSSSPMWVILNLNITFS